MGLHQVVVDLSWFLEQENKPKEGQQATLLREPFTLVALENKCVNNTGLEQRRCGGEKFVDQVWTRSSGANTTVEPSYVVIREDPRGPGDFVKRRRPPEPTRPLPKPMRQHHYHRQAHLTSKALTSASWVISWNTALFTGTFGSNTCSKKEKTHAPRETQWEAAWSMRTHTHVALTKGHLGKCLI